MLALFPRRMNDVLKYAIIAFAIMLANAGRKYFHISFPGFSCSSSYTCLGSVINAKMGKIGWICDLRIAICELGFAISDLRFRICDLRIFDSPI